MEPLAPTFDASNPALDRLGSLGLWASLEGRPIEDLLAYARRAEALGFDALWINEISGREPFAQLGALAVSTSRIGLAVGIASIYARDASAAHAGARTVTELAGGRFVMGLGVSHRERVEDERGHVYGPPLPAMSAYLDAYAASRYTAALPAEEPPLVLAAMGPRMLELAGRATDGAFPYFVPARYLPAARAALDAAAVAAGRESRPALCVSLAVVASDSPDAARGAARAYTAGYLRRENYRRNLERLGYPEPDLAAPGSDRLVDDLVAWGDAAAIRNRAEDFRRLGADHLVLVPVGPDGTVTDPDTSERLAEILLG